MKTPRAFLVWIVATGLMTGSLLFLFIRLPIPMIIPCTDPLAQDLLLALSVSLIIQVIIRHGNFPINSSPVWVALLLIGLSVLWLGSYPFSPLGFSSGRIPVLRGFNVTKFARRPFTLDSGERITVTSHSLTYIKAITQQVDESCYWASMEGGEFDDPTSCEVAYRAPGGADHDVLKLLVKPSCKLPDAHGEIRVSILP
jgi:hypothetical protein